MVSAAGGKSCARGCRGTYHCRAQREEIVNGLVNFLRPGGVMILGPGELLDWHYRNMEKVRYDDTAAYRRTD